MRRLAAVAALGLALLGLVGGLFLSGLLVEREAADSGAMPGAVPGRQSGPLASDTDPAPRTGRVEVARGEAGGGAAARAAGGADLSGRAVDPAGEPVPDVEVSLTDLSGARAARTDAAGRFRLEGVLGWKGLEARKPGWALLREPEAPRPRDDGTWPELEWVLAPTAGLRVLVRDAAGRPVEGVRIEAGVSPAEPYAHARSRWVAFRPEEVEAESGVGGVARLEGVPTGLRLVLRVRSEGSTLDLEHQRGGVAVSRRGEGDLPIVLERGEVGELTIELAARLRVHGRVLGPDGAPAPASVTLRSLDPLPPGAPELSLTQRTQADGVFDLVAVPAVLPRRVLLDAQGTAGERPSLSPFGGTKLPDPLLRAWSVVRLSGHGEQQHERTLTLAPTLAIAGTVEDAAGGDVDVRIELIAQQDDPAGELPATGWARTRSLHRPGAFRFTGLPSGLYDVVVRSSQRETVEVPAVAAGTEDLLVRLQGEPSARVTLEVSSEVELEQTIVLAARYHPRGLLPFEVEPLPSTAVHSRALGWPEEALGLWYGSQVHSDSRGAATFASWPIQGTTTTLERAPGLYWFGAKARTVDGLYCFPVGTGLVRLEPGEHHVRLELVPTGALEGRVSGAAPGTDLCVALALPDGRLVPVDVRRERMSALVELGADGRFALSSVPGGALDLRLGSPDQLRRGRWQRSVRVVVRPGETTRVELGP